MNEIKQKNVDFFKNQLASLLKDTLLAQKFVIVHNEKIVGAHDTFSNALGFAVNHFPSDEFIIQQVIDESNSINFHATAA